MIKKQLATITSIVTFIFTGFFFIDARYGYAQDVKSNTMEIKEIKTGLVYEKALNDYYSTKALLRKYPDDEELKEQLAKAKEEVDFLKKKLNKKLVKEI